MLYGIAITLLILLFFTILFIGSKSSKRDNMITLNRINEDEDSKHHQ